mgnify:CR=1 FL=1
MAPSPFIPSHVYLICDWLLYLSLWAVRAAILVGWWLIYGATAAYICGISYINVILVLLLRQFTHLSYRSLEGLESLEAFLSSRITTCKASRATEQTMHELETALDTDE